MTDKPETETIEERAARLMNRPKTYRKFTSKKVFDIYRLLELGVSQSAIARDEGVDVQVIHNIKEGNTYIQEYRTWLKHKAQQEQSNDD